MHGVVNFFGRISFLVEQNTQASYFFMTAMLQVLLSYMHFFLLPVFESNESLVPVLKLLSSRCRLALRPVRYALRRACTVCAAFARSEKKAKEGGQHSGARSAGVRGT
jgi:hypothetical protein